jgi:hypothetical protein
MKKNPVRIEATSKLKTGQAPKMQRPAPKGVGMYDSGLSDISERAEELLFKKESSDV